LAVNRRFARRLLDRLRFFREAARHHQHAENYPFHEPIFSECRPRNGGVGVRKVPRRKSFRYHRRCYTGNEPAP
jgi:hypothetical protein